MARRKRIARDRPQQVTARIQSQIERRLPFFDPLDEQSVVRLEAQVDWIIRMSVSRFAMTRRRWRCGVNNPTSESRRTLSVRLPTGSANCAARHPAASRNSPEILSAR